MSTRPNPISSPDELTTIRGQLGELALQLNYVQEHQKVLAELRDLKINIDQKWTYLKAAGALGTVFLSLIGLFGFKTVNDVKSHAKDRIEQAVRESTERIDRNVKETKEFYDDLMAASARIARKEYASSIPSLLKWFNQGHTYDKSVVIPLLTAVDVMDDWFSALPVVAKLRSDPAKFDEINDALVYTLIAAIEVQSGLTELGPVSNPKDDGAKRMESGFALLHRASTMPPNDDETRRQILTNYWIYYIAKRDFKKSGEMIEALYELPPRVRVWSWKHASGWKCMKALSQQDRSSSVMSTAEQQWSHLRSRYIPD